MQKKFLYLPSDAISIPTVAVFLREYPVEIDDTGVLRFDISNVASDCFDVIKDRLNSENLSYDICVLDEFPTITYSRPDGEKTLCSFIRKREIQNVLGWDMSAEDKLARIAKMVAVEKIETISDCVRKKRKG